MNILEFSHERASMKLCRDFFNLKQNAQRAKCGYILMILFGNGNGAHNNVINGCAGTPAFKQSIPGGPPPYIDSKQQHTDKNIRFIAAHPPGPNSMQHCIYGTCCVVSLSGV